MQVDYRNINRTITSMKSNLLILLFTICGRKMINVFVRREERRGIGLRKFLSKKAKGRKGVGLEIICPSKKREGE